jgi:lipoprotein-anchoring transpeptidase ErfK/SrfK
MLRTRKLELYALIMGVIMGALTQAVLAQSCDDRFPWTCPGFTAPPLQAPQPTVPLTPRVNAPPPASGRLVPGPVPMPNPVAPAVAGRPGTRTQPIDPAHFSWYASLGGEPFPIPSVNLTQIDPQFLRRIVPYPTREPPGTIIIDPRHRFLYLVQGRGQAIRYGVGVGREGFGWSGTATIREKREWPDWYPPKEMIQRQPELQRQLTRLQSGIGMAGGPRNPLGSRALYLWQGNKDTLFRIHGTVEPWTIGRSVSSGCIRMINQDVIELYQRTPIGAKVIVLGAQS